jgi:hypothetical protein
MGAKHAGISATNERCTELETLARPASRQRRPDETTTARQPTRRAEQARRVSRQQPVIDMPSESHANESTFNSNHATPNGGRPTNASCVNPLSIALLVESGCPEVSAVSEPTPLPTGQEPHSDRVSEPSAAPNGLGRDPRTGRFTTGAVASVRHGLFSDRDLAGLNADVARFIAGSISDDGGDDNIPTRRRADLEYRARLHRRIVQLDNAFEAKGLFDGRHKLRVGWLQRLEGLIATAARLDGMLGLERRQRRVPTLAEVLSDGE